MTADNRYSHGKIYKLIDNTTGVFYIGSTALKRLDHRLRTHIKTSTKQNKTNNIYKLYKYCTPEKLRSDCVRTILIQEVNVNSKNDLLKIENSYIETELNNDVCLNTRRAFRDDKQRNQYSLEQYYKHREARLTRCNEYRHENAEQIKQIRSKLYSCPCGSSSILFDHKSRHERTQKHIKFMNELQD